MVRRDTLRPCSSKGAAIQPKDESARNGCVSRKLRLDTAGEEDEGKKEEGENAKNEGARRMRDMRK